MISFSKPKLSGGIIALVTLLLLASMCAAEPVGWRLLPNLKAEEFDRQWETLRQQWFRVEFVRAYDLQDSPRLAGLWLRNTDGRKWASKYGLSQRSFATEMQRLHDDGYRLVDLSGFNDGGEASFAAVWVENKEGLAWATSHALPSDKFDDDRKTRTAAGLRPIVLQAYELERHVYYNLLWVANKEESKWSLHRDLTGEQFTAQLKAEREAGFRPLSYTTYTLGRVALYGIVCVENKEKLDWQLLRDQTEGEFQATQAKLKDHYRPLALDVYDSAAGPRHGSIWIENK